MYILSQEVEAHFSARIPGFEKDLAGAGLYGYETKGENGGSTRHTLGHDMRYSKYIKTMFTQFAVGEGDADTTAQSPHTNYAGDEAIESEANAVKVELDDL